MKTLDECLIENNVPLWVRENVKKALNEWIAENAVV
jgi:hypothetical protein